MVFLVLMYSGHFFWMAYWKQLCAKPEMDCRGGERSLQGPAAGRLRPGMAPFPAHDPVWGSFVVSAGPAPLAPTWGREQPPSLA